MKVKDVDWGYWRQVSKERELFLIFKGQVWFSLVGPELEGYICGSRGWGRDGQSLVKSYSYVL